MILTLFVWLIAFLFACFTLGGIPLPPLPGRPFTEIPLGFSRYPLFDETNQLLSSYGREAPAILIIGLLLVIFSIWVFVKRSSLLPHERNRLPIFGFVVMMSLSFVAADFVRENSAAGASEYLDARIHWLTNFGEVGYPVAPTLALKGALHSKSERDVASALREAAVPEFGKIPAYPNISPSCVTVFEGFLKNSGPVPEENDNQYSDYRFSCHLLMGIVAQLGRAAVSDPMACTYGPAVKILHALDRQHFTCAKGRLTGVNAPSVICPKFEAEFGTRHFAFCRSDRAGSPSF